jgi:hypothetical protein
MQNIDYQYQHSSSLLSYHCVALVALALLEPLFICCFAVAVALVVLAAVALVVLAAVALVVIEVVALVVQAAVALVVLTAVALVAAVALVVLATDKFLLYSSTLF